jgi:DNA helicase-2/ATP-dependent DNA helicase PcrA
LLAERAALAQGDVIDVVLPQQLSVSQLVELQQDPAALARVLRRPVPHRPAPWARRGTAFHTWLEQRWQKQTLLDLDELPGAADEGADDSEFVELRAAFEASEWAQRTPAEVEVPFEMKIGERVVRGRMDAVFRDRREGGGVRDSGEGGGVRDSGEGGGVRDSGEGGGVRDSGEGGVFRDAEGWLVVDWKTGRKPTGAAAQAAAVQLAAYRLAWARLNDIPDAELHRVRAAFHYVRSGETVEPNRLLDADGLRALIVGSES